MSAGTTENPTDQQPQDQQPGDATGTNGGNAEGQQDERRFSQADVDRLITERLERERRRSEQERERAEAAAEERRLAEQQEFQRLAEQRGERIVELETRVQQIESLTQERDDALSVVRTLVEQELSAAPDYVRDAIADRNPVAQLQYLNQHRDKWSKNLPMGARETGKASQPREMTKEDLKNKYLKQAGRLPA